MDLGSFIVIEGPNGVGKSTIIEVLFLRLKENGVEVVPTKEPSKSELGLYIRQNQNRYSKDVLACLVAANRYEHIETIIRPAVEKGKVVLCDRYFPSSLVYQLMDGLDPGFVHGLNQKILIPDLTVFLTASENILKERLNQRDDKTRFEFDQKMEIDLYKEACLSQISNGWNIIELDSGQLEVADIVDKIIEAIEKI